MQTKKQKFIESPAALGYRMPAEWEPHEATWLAWPHNQETWPGQLEEVAAVYSDLVNALARGEKVKILVDNEPEEEAVRTKLARRGVSASQLVFYRIPTGDAWIRDYGPLFVRRKNGKGPSGLSMIHWIFNAWGGKYESFMTDNQVPDKMLSILNLPYFEPGMVLEGGSIDVNGEGILLTTEQCLLNANRNPSLKKVEIEEYLRDFLGVTDIVWLGAGIAGDDTDGHVDDMARFVVGDTVLCAVESDSQDSNYTTLRDNRKRLEEARDSRGNKFRIVELPMPGKVEGPDGRLPASYANFYIGNSAVLVPVYGHFNDRAALRILKEVFPGREIVGIPCHTLVYGLGAIHCVTLQEPAVI